MKSSSATFDLTRYDDLLHRVYGAALEPSQWTDTIRAIAELFDARRALLYTFMHSPARRGFCFTHNLPQNEMEAWADVSVAEDPFVQAGLRNPALIADGMALTGDQMVPRSELVGSRMYRDIWQPMDIEHVCVAVVFGNADERRLPTAMSLYRSRSDDAFSPQEVDWIRRLLLHMSRSLGVMFHLRDQAQQVASSRAAFDRLLAGVVLLDSTQSVQFVNSAAKDLLHRAQVVRLHTEGANNTGRLVAVGQLPPTKKAFERALGDAVAPLREARGKHFSQGVVLQDRLGRASCVMHASPLTEAQGLASAGGTRANAIVLLHELSGGGRLDMLVLCRLFGMTPAEARAASQVLEGGSIIEMAQRLNVSANTLKTQLKAVYAKTNTARQVDLLKLLLALCNK